MAIYKTKQKDNILNILEHNKTKQLTIMEIKQLADKSNLNIGITTIYRFINEFEEGNKLLRTLNEKGEAEYQLVDKSCENHFHLKCTNCGKFIHMDCDEFKDLSEHILKHHYFHIDTIATTVFGLCDECYKLKNKGE